MKNLIPFILLIISILSPKISLAQQADEANGSGIPKQEVSDKRRKVTHVKKRIRRRDLKKMKLKHPQKSTFAEKRRLERIARREKMKKRGGSELLHHGHEKVPKKRRLGKRIHCTECGIKH